jgi:hypothetical protein
MISPVNHPALEAFVAWAGAERVFGEVRVRRAGGEFVLTHAAEAAEKDLRVVAVDDLRALAQHTERGAFRPLKSAPTLRRGWICRARDAAELDAALRHLYPGGMADWFAAQQTPPPATGYRAFTARQTGMYRITTMLDDAQVAQVTRAGCHREVCLKRRLWPVEGLPAETAAEKSELACLEPCALLLEFARTVARLEQKGGALPSGSGTPSDGIEIREGDFSSPLNPRLVLWRREKQQAASAEKVTG